MAVAVKCLLLFLSIYGVLTGVNGITVEDDISEWEEIPCRFPGAPAHSSVVFTNESLAPGTVATYTCERGFELLGPARRVCEHDGNWEPEGIPFCVLNVAAGKAPMQISTEDGGIPQKAIDGSTSAFYTGDTCTLTRTERVPWWYVNLLEPYMVQLVRLDFGKSCCGPNKQATVVVRVGNNRPDLGTNPICNRFTGYLEEGQPLFLPCNPPMPGAFVSVHLESPTQLSICEAFVYTDQALPIERCPQFRDQPPGSTATYNGKCYIFYNRQPLRFRDALAFCRSRGGTLVDESNPALQGFISWELWRRHRSDTNSQYWMGATRDPQERNNWKWLNGEDVTVSFWNLPGGNEDCARYDGSKGWLWSDTNCNLNLNYICQHQPKACGRPEQPPNSTMVAKNFNVGANIEYSCDEGHLLVGPTTRTCLDTGFYNEFPPVCKRIQCGYPADILNGEYHLTNGSVGYLSHVIYECDDGYEMIGRPQLTCDIDERWNGPPPRCEPIQCEPPALLQNGRFTTSNNDTIFGTVVEYFCTRGFRLFGAKQLICQTDGQYDKPPPICKEDLTTVSASLPTTTHRRPTRPPPSTTTRQRPKPTQPSQTTLAPQKPILPPMGDGVSSVSATGPVESHPGRVREDKHPYRGRRPPAVTSSGDNSNAGTAHVPHIIVATHPQDNEIPNSNHGRHDETANVNVPLPVDNSERREPFGARLNLGAIIALGAFGGFVFLAAIITTVVILVRRNQSAKHYRHRASPDCNTVASFDSSSSESRNGLNRYYRQAWENLHESAGSKAGLKASGSSGANHSPLRRKETLDEPHFTRERHREGSAELVVSDGATPANAGGQRASVTNAGEKKRHHHHHHHHEARGNHKDWAPRNSPHHREHNHNRKY